ncbi:hypothetical protein LTR99_000574 [Exophiala xenobiotica]|nr:hypothetical protein LTR99_000574 [Exophiala xenobiotica]KAK5439605.1 hypothetical protein LTR34_000573 [Exophiala xenobiotica]
MCGLSSAALPTEVSQSLCAIPTFTFTSTSIHDSSSTSNPTPSTSGPQQSSAGQPHHLRDLERPKVLDLTYAKSYAFTRALPSTVPHCISSGRLDGFHELPVPGGEQPELHQAVYSLLNFKIGAATAFPLPAGLAVNDIGGSMIVPVMTNTTLCLSVIAAWKAVQVLTRQTSDYSYLSYEAQALQSLRKQIDTHGHEALTDEAIMAASILWATATMFAQPEALRRHAAGVRSLVTARGGGLHKLGGGGAIQQLILWADFLTAQFLGEDIRFKDIGSAEPLPASLRSIYDSIIIPEPFDRSLLPETLEAAKDLRLLLVCHDKASRTGNITIAEYKALMSLLNRSTVRRISMEYKLKDSKTIDECVVLAMNLMRLTSLFHAGPLYLIVVKVIERLRLALGRTALQQWSRSECLNIYIWACMVGLVHDFPTTERSHFADMVAGALKVKYKTAWPEDWPTDCLTMLRSFLWSEARLTDLYEDVCGMINLRLGSSPAAEKV